MTKTKGFLLTAGIVLATTFTLFACSDDKNDPPTTGKACSVEPSPMPGITACLGFDQTITQADCDKGADEGEKLTLLESCPPDETLKCDMGRGMYVYIYGEVGFTCETMPHD